MDAGSRKPPSLAHNFVTQLDNSSISLPLSPPFSEVSRPMQASQRVAETTFLGHTLNNNNNGSNEYPTPLMGPTFSDPATSAIPSVVATLAATDPVLVATPTDAPTRSGKGRKAFACEVCRRRKVRCDLARPRCANCDRRRTVCVYRNALPTTRKNMDVPGVKNLSHDNNGSVGTERRLSVTDGTRKERNRKRQISIKNEDFKQLLDNAPPVVTEQGSATDGLLTNFISPSPLSTSSFVGLLEETPAPQATKLSSSWVAGTDHININENHSFALNSIHPNKTTICQTTDSEENRGIETEVPSSTTYTTLQTTGPVVSSNDNTYAVVRQSDISSTTIMPEMLMAFNPPPGLVQHLVALFVTQASAQMPIFTLGWLQDGLEQGSVSPALTCAMTALATWTPCARAANKYSTEIGRYMANRAADLLQRSSSVASLSHIQAAVLMDLYNLGEGKKDAAQQYRQYAHQMLNSRLTHLVDDSKTLNDSGRPSQGQDLMETCGRLWWCTFLIDRLASISDDREGELDDKNCYFSLPEDECERDVVDQDGLETIQPQRLNWRGRIIQLAELLLQVTVLLKRTRSATITGNENEIAAHRRELESLERKFGKLGGITQGLEPYRRVKAALARLLATPKDAAATRALLAYKVLFRVFAHCLHRNVQLALCQIHLALPGAQSDQLRVVQLRAVMVPAAIEIAELTEQLPDDLITCICPFQAFTSASAGMVMFDIVTSAPDDEWVGCTPNKALEWLRQILRFHERMEPQFLGSVQRKEMLRKRLQIAEAHLAKTSGTCLLFEL